MPLFEIEITCRVPEFVQLLVDAKTPEEAQRRAYELAGDNVDACGQSINWTSDYECAGDNYITGVWLVDNPDQDADKGDSLPVLPEFAHDTSLAHFPAPPGSRACLVAYLNRRGNPAAAAFSNQEAAAAFRAAHKGKIINANIDAEAHGHDANPAPKPSPA